MILYGLKNCDKCRGALKDLRSEGREVIFKDIRLENLTAQTIADWWAFVGEGLLNRRSTTWRNLKDTERESDPIVLMQKHPSVIKRPVIVTKEGRVFCGWKKGKIIE